MGFFANLFRRKAGAPSPAYSGGWSGGSPFVDSFGKKRAPTPWELVAETLGTAYTCATYNSELVAQTQGRLYLKTRKGESRGKLSLRGETKAVGNKAWSRLQKSSLHNVRDAASLEEVTAHPLLDLLNKPTPAEDGAGVNYFVLWELTQRYQEVVGRAAWYVPRDGPGKTPSAIWMLAPQYTTEWPGMGDESPVIERYEYFGGRGKNVYTPDEVVPFRMGDMSTAGYIGGSGPMRACFEHTKLLRQADGLTTARVENGGRPSAVWSPTGEFSMISEDEARRMQVALRQRFSMAGAGGILITNTPGQLSTLAWPINDIIDAARYELTRTQIAAAFKVPNTILDRKDSNLASAKTGDYAHAMHAGLPRLRNNEGAVNQYLIPMYGPEAAERLFFAYDDPAAMRDWETEREERKTAVDSGAMTRAEQRAELNLPPEPWAEPPLVNRNYIPLDASGKPDLAYLQAGGKGGGAPPGQNAPDEGGKGNADKSVLRELAAVKRLLPGKGVGNRRRPFAGAPARRTATRRAALPAPCPTLRRPERY